MRKIKAVTVKIKTVTGVDKGGKNLIYVVYSVYEINSKIYFPSRHIIFGGGFILYLYKDILSWQTCFIWVVILD